jgi:Cu/Ag efflux pump CusA
MAVVILGGLATSTVLNLLLLPALYSKYGRPVEREQIVHQARTTDS